ncbi:MAG: hypothetical protein PUP92_25265 [Rhizonema sp. PD38]|nr:hypothetical protein [Rhizonema sp. PD38]
MPFDKLKQFRSSVYTLLGKAKDALFDLMDAVLVTRSVYSFVELSVSPVFRRQWSSIYEALEDSNPPREELMKLYIKQLSQTEQIVLAGDHTAWPRLDAVTLKERTYEHQAQPMSGAKPVTVGQGYSTIAIVPETEGSWALPLLHERITSFENPLEKAAAQLRLVCQNLPTRPLSLWDAEYGCASFVKQTADISADKLMRLRSNRSLYGAPPPYTGIGRPRGHGDKFKLNDPTTWWTPDKVLEILDPKLGRMRLPLWYNLHFQQSAEINMHVIQVERLDAALIGKARPLWLIWVGEGIPELSQIWRQYLRRFAVDHWYRFAKQRLHWTLPKLGTREQCERWSDLMPLLTWQLWLARAQVNDCPLPWQKSVTNLTPGRVAQSMGGVFAAIGTPAQPPKSRGKSPGWPTGQPRPRKIRCPIVKKGTARPKKQHSKSA